MKTVKGRLVICPEGQSLLGVPKKGIAKGLCSAWPTAGALKSVFQRWEEGKARMGIGMGRGCSPSRRASLGGLLPPAPVGAPPI